MKPIKSKSFEQYIAEGILARLNKDNSQWSLGDLAGQIETDYGHDTIGEFAQAIGVEKKTLMNYRTVAARFPQQFRKDFPDISFSHFSLLCVVKTPEAWLAQIRLNKWTVEKLSREIQQVYIKSPILKNEPPVVFECKECHKWRLKDMSSFDICRGHYENINGKIIYK